MTNKECEDRIAKLNCDIEIAKKEIDIANSRISKYYKKINELREEQYGKKTQLIIVCAQSVSYFKDMIKKSWINLDYDNEKCCALGANEVVNRVTELIKHLKNNKGSVIYAYTVHSTSLNIIGNCIENRRIPQDMCKILYVENNGKTIECTYDNRGFLLNWTFGGLEWDYDILANAEM